MGKKLKQNLKFALAGLLYYSGAFTLCCLWRQRRSGRKVCVLGLHRVLTEEQLHSANSLEGIILHEKTFAAVLEFLGRSFSIISLDSFLRGPKGPGRSAKPRCLLTFDDGWKDNYITALPLLKRFNIPATVFAVAGLIGTERTFWVERLMRIWRDDTRRDELRATLEAGAGAVTEQDWFGHVVERLKHMPAAQRDQILEPLTASPEGLLANGDLLLTWEEARQMQREGIEIEAHSVSHPLLVYEDDCTVKHELQDGKLELEQKLGKKIRAFAYPNGTWDQRVRKLVQDAGYECAFVTERGWYREGDDPFSIRRILLHEGCVTSPRGRFSPALMSMRIAGWI